MDSAKKITKYKTPFLYSTWLAQVSAPFPLAAPEAANTKEAVKAAKSDVFDNTWEGGRNRES